VGHVLVSAAYRIQIGNPTTKAVLIALADAGCNACGLGWPGVPLLSEKTELGGSTVRRSLEALTKQGLIRILRYPNGGRGVATEYRVLEQVIELSTCPCGNCRLKMKNPPAAGTYDIHGTPKPSRSERVSGNTLSLTRENPPAAGTQQSVTSNSQGKENSPAARHVTSDPHPTTDAEWSHGAREAARLASLFGPTDTPDRGYTVKEGRSDAETDAIREEAQD
jgi:hypothetical protein